MITKRTQFYSTARIYDKFIYKEFNCSTESFYSILIVKEV
jgi:hypothetical protein